MVRVIVTGSREWSDPNAIRAKISDRLCDLPGDSLIVVGYDEKNDRPKGVDRFAYQEAQKLGLALETHPAEWEKFGKGAGFRRNTEMAQLGADLCLAFHNGRSSGTKHMIEQAEKYGIPVEIVT